MMLLGPSYLRRSTAWLLTLKSIYSILSKQRKGGGKAVDTIRTCDTSALRYDAQNAVLHKSRGVSPRGAFI